MVVKIVQRPAFETSDGTTYDTREDAEKYEFVDQMEELLQTSSQDQPAEVFHAIFDDRGEVMKLLRAADRPLGEGEKTARICSSHSVDDDVVARARRYLAGATAENQGTPLHRSFSFIEELCETIESERRDVLVALEPMRSKT